MTTDVLFHQSELNKLSQETKTWQSEVDMRDALKRLQSNADFRMLMHGFITEETVRQVGMSISTKLTPELREAARIAYTAGSVLEAYFDRVEHLGDIAESRIEESHETSVYHNQSINQGA